VRRLPAVLALVVLAGCGGEPKRVVSTPTATATHTPAPTATATPKPAGSQRAQERLTRFLSTEAQDRGRICSVAGELPGAAIAASDCDYDGDSEGSYLLFESRSDMRAAFNRLRRGGKTIHGQCEGPYWYRHSRGKDRVEGPLAFVRLDGEKLMVWGDDSRRVLGTIRAKNAPVKEMCSIWKTRA
jgi:hypothetical protein